MVFVVIVSHEHCLPRMQLPYVDRVLALEYPPGDGTLQTADRFAPRLRFRAA